jgi:hypothetical protein
MAAPTGLLREIERHFLRLLESTDQVAKTVSGGEKLDCASFEHSRAGVTIDATKVRLLTLLHPTAAMYAREVLRDDAIECLPDLEMQWRIAGKVAGVAKIVVSFDSIASDHADSAEQDKNRHR